MEWISEMKSKLNEMKPTNVDVLVAARSSATESGDGTLKTATAMGSDAPVLPPLSGFNWAGHPVTRPEESVQESRCDSGHDCRFYGASLEPRTIVDELLMKSLWIGHGQYQRHNWKNVESQSSVRGFIQFQTMAEESQKESRVIL